MGPTTRVQFTSRLRRPLRAFHPLGSQNIASRHALGDLQGSIIRSASSRGSSQLMAMGAILWYMLLWQQNLRHWSVLHTAAGWSPFLVIATLGSLMAAWLVPRLAAQWIIAIGTVTAAMTSLLLATMPRQQSYWAQMFPAAIFMSLCPDLTFTTAQIIASNAVRRHEHGVAGSLIGTLNLFGNPVGLGFAATVESRVAKDSGNTVLGYRSALFFGLGISVAALLIDIVFVMLVKDEREGWDHVDDEDDDGVVVPLAWSCKGWYRLFSKSGRRVELSQNRSTY